MAKAKKKTAFLVYWQDVVSGGMDGGVFQRDHVVCMTEEARDREMARMVEKEKREWEEHCPGEEFEPTTSARTGDKEGAHFKEIKIID